MKVASKITLPVLIKNGKFASNKDRIIEIVKCYEGMTIDITFSKRINKRSVKQNKYYWKVIVGIFLNSIEDAWGEIWSKEDVHEFLKANCNYVEEVNEDTGEIIRKTRSTTKNNTSNQEQFHEKCRQLSYNFFNITIPLPNEGVDIDFQNEEETP